MDTIAFYSIKNLSIELTMFIKIWVKCFPFSRMYPSHHFLMDKNRTNLCLWLKRDERLNIINLDFKLIQRRVENSLSAILTFYYTSGQWLNRLVLLISLYQLEIWCFNIEIAAIQIHAVIHFFHVHANGSWFEYLSWRVFFYWICVQNLKNQSASV